MKTQQPFTAYLLKQVDRRDPVGDLARDMSDDPTWPKRGGTLAYFETYLYKQGAISGAIDALYSAWDEYGTWLSNGGQVASGKPDR